MRSVAAGVMFIIACASSPLGAQTLPPVAGKKALTQETKNKTAKRARDKAAAKAKGKAGTLTAESTLAGEPIKFCEDPGKNWLLPLACADTRAKGTESKDGHAYILDFYGRNGSINPADQIQLLYSFGTEPRKGLAADLAALIFPGGWRFAVGSSVSASGNDSGAQTPEQAVQRLREGGDMYVNASYPLISAGSGGGSYLASVYFVPRVNFLFNGFANTQTITEANESTVNVGVEAYFEMRDLQKKGGAFVYTRLGSQHVSPEFKTAANLDSQTFGAFEIAIGAQVGELLRISVQRFHAPPAAAGVTLDQLEGWHLVLQLAPKAR